MLKVLVLVIISYLLLSYSTLTDIQWLHAVSFKVYDSTQLKRKKARKYLTGGEQKCKNLMDGQ